MLSGRTHGNVPPPVHGTGTDGQGMPPFSPGSSALCRKRECHPQIWQVRQGLPVAAMTHHECITAGLSQRGTAH